MRRSVPCVHVLTLALAVGHEATVRTDCACTPVTVVPIPREQLAQPEPTSGVSALLSGRATAAGSASTLLSARSVGSGELLRDQSSAFEVFRLR
jgi:hypothetical protein